MEQFNSPIHEPRRTGRTVSVPATNLSSRQSLDFFDFYPKKTSTRKKPNAIISQSFYPNFNPTIPMTPTTPRLFVSPIAVTVAYIGISFFSLNFSLSSASVTYTMQTGNFNSLQTERNNNPPYAGTYNNSATELGQYANGGSFGNTPGAAAFQTFTITGNGSSGTARALQVGDTFTITGFTSANPSSGGRIGISFRDSTTYTNFFSSTDNTTEARFQLENTGGWRIYRDGGNIDSNLGSNTDRTFVIKITSSNTFDAQVGGTWFYNNTMAAGGGSIDSFAIYTFGDSNANSFWKNATLADTGTVELGYALASGSFTPGVIADGLDANSTSSVRVNNVFIGGDAGSQVNLDQANTYTGTTTINTNATAEAQHANALGGTGAGTTVSSGGALKLFSQSGISYASEALTLNGTGVSGANGALRNVGGNNTWTGAVTLAGNTRINADNSGGNGSLTISGGITGGANALFVGARESANINLTGAISGSGASLSDHGNVTTSIFKDGGAALTLNGANTFSGATLLNNGTILIGNNSAFGTGTIQIHWSANNTKLLASTDGTARTISNALNVYNDLNLGAGDRTGSLNFTGTVDLGNTVTDQPNRFITTADTTSHSFGNLSGNRSLIKQGGGTLNLNGSTNTASGFLAIDNGVLNLGGGNIPFSAIGIGSGVDGDQDQNNATLRVTGTTAAFTPNITVNGEGTAGTRTIDFANTSGNATLSGSLSLEKAVTIQVANAGATGVLSGAISGSGGPQITVQGSGTFRPTSVDSTTSATWRVENGATLALNHTRNLGENPEGHYDNKIVLAGGTLRATDTFTTNANVGLNATSSSSVSVDTGRTLTFQGGVRGSAGLTKSGEGTLNLTHSGASNTYNGTWTVQAGTLLVNTNHAGAVTVNSSGTLGGNSTISGLVTLNSGGTLAPGNSIGTMNFSAGLTLNSTSTVRMEISNVNGSADRINVSGGQLTYAGNLVFDAQSMAGVTNNTYTLFNTTGATTSGSWASVALAGGDSPAFVNNSGIWTRNTGDGNVWTYDQGAGTLTVVPEPSTYALMGVGAAFLLWRIRRRKRD